MKFLRLYVRVLEMLGPEARLGWTLSLAGIALAASQFIEPILFGRIIDMLANSQGGDRAALDWYWLSVYLGAWVGFGLFIIVCSAIVALYADRASLDAAADRFDRTDRNVEFVIAGPGDDLLVMRVVERGAGETQACGTGACAAAWAANRWGLVGERVTVSMPGGDVVVELGDDVRLIGPSAFVADVDWEPAWH